MKKAYLYLVCKRTMFRGLQPIRIYTALNTAKMACVGHDNYVILRQRVEGNELEPVQDNK